MLHQKLPQLCAFGDEEMDRLIEFVAGEIKGADEGIRAGGHVQMIIFLVEGQGMKLPGLAAIEAAQAVGIDFLLAEIDDAGQTDVLLDPGILDGLGVHAVETLGQIAEGAADVFLDRQDVVDLFGAQDALFNQ